MEAIGFCSAQRAPANRENAGDNRKSFRCFCWRNDGRKPGFQIMLPQGLDVNDQRFVGQCSGQDGSRQ